MTDRVRAETPDAERAFFRSEFRHRTLVIALCGGGGGDEFAIGSILPALGPLLDAACRLVVCVPRGQAADCAADVGAPVRDVPTSGAELAELWIAVEDHQVVVVGMDADVAPAAADVAVRLGVSKLVITDPEGGWGPSFASEEDLGDDGSPRPIVAGAIRRALAGGVDGVNLCRFEDLDTELFTFDGAGTLFTADAYLSVSPLVADDFPVVEGLVQRGVAEGYLRPRSRAETIRLALGGLGARVSPSGHLAGFGTLERERYAGERLAEVACLYAINRFSGEGVGAELVDGLVAQARGLGNRAVFACTVSERAAGLFVRCGFGEVGLDRLPEQKWVGYDPERRRRLRALWLDLGS